LFFHQVIWLLKTCFFSSFDQQLCICHTQNKWFEQLMERWPFKFYAFF
jgi:hypothetical protein